MSYFAFGLGIGTQSSTGELLEAYYAKPILHVEAALIKAIADTINYDAGNHSLAVKPEQLKQLASALTTAGFKEQAELATTLANSEEPLLVTILETDAIPTSTAEAYLKLTLLSQRLVKPHGLNLEGIFSLLPNVAWTSDGAIAVEDLPQRQLKARVQGKLLQVYSVDKFPQMANYVVPKGIRIGATQRIRLGAYVGEGSTVMHEGFINFNAGTLGTSMVEGRISSGVVVGNGSDIGGGASTMGTLSGGNNTIISIGENCLLGANAGLGLPLGERCTLEAGLYVTAGCKVTLLDDQNNIAGVVKAAQLAGKTDLLFRRNSQNGRIEVKTNKSAIELNQELHKHN